MKELVKSFHMNGHTLGFHSQTHLVQHNKQYHMKVLLNSFYSIFHTLGQTNDFQDILVCKWNNY